MSFVAAQQSAYDGGMETILLILRGLLRAVACELQAPPVPIIIAERDARRGGELREHFAPTM